MARQRQNLFLWLPVVVLGLLALLPPAAGAAPPPGLEMDAEAAFGGLFKFGEWLPVWVNLENSGPDLDAEVQVSLTGSWGTTTFATPVSLPAGSRKRVPVYVLPNNYSHELQVKLISGDEVLLSQKVPVSPRVNITYLAGLISPERGALSLLLGITLPGQNRPLELVDLDLADLPERADALRSFDLLVLNDVDTQSLTPQQRAALEAWVREGGRLVIGGGAGAARVAAGLPAALLPVTPRGDEELDSLTGLADYAGGEPVRVPGPFLAATGEEGAGQTLAGQDGLPLVRERIVGSGSVDWVALDLATSPFDAWSGATAFWERLLAPGAAYPPWLATDMSSRQMQAGSMTYALTNMPALDLPSVQGLAVLLGVYVLVIGPINYLVLRWRRKLHWAWVTIPLITLLFAAGAFGLGYVMRGSDIILNKVALVALRDDGTANVRGFVGLFSPSQRSYEIQIPGSFLLSSLNPDYNPWGPGGMPTSGEMVFVQGDPGQVRGLAVNQWSMQAVMAEGTWPDFGRVSADLRLDGQAITGQVHNDSDHTFTDAVLILGNSFVRLGDLPPGSQAAVRMDVSNLAAQQFGPPVSYRLFEAEFNKMGGSGPSREAQMKQSLVDNLFQQGGKFGPATFSSSGAAGLQGLVFLGWLDQAPPSVQVADRTPLEKATALVYAPLAYQLPPGERVSVPPGLIAGSIQEMPRDGGFCGMAGTTAVYISQGQAVLEFHVPEPDDIQVDQINLNLRSDGGWWQAPEMAAYDWQAGDWASLGEVALGSIALGDAGRLVSDDGRIRLRLSFENAGGGGGCTYLDLGVDGTRR